MPTRAFTLIELMVAILVVAVLVGLLLAAARVVRRSAQATAARDTLGQLHAAFELYRQEEGRDRYPAVDPDDASISRRRLTTATDGVLALLERRGSFVPPPGGLDDGGRLLDPWARPWRYTLERPIAATPALLPAWNWDANAGHELRWGRRRDPATGATTTGALPFPYIRSLGRDGDADDPRGWIVLDTGG